METFVKGLILLLFMFIGSKAFSYNYTSDFKRGIYWNSFPLKMKLYIQSGDDYELLKEQVELAVDEWENAVGMDIWDVDDNEYSGPFAGNYIRWSNDFAQETGYSAFNTLAVAVRYSDGVHFTRTEIVLNGEMSTLRQNFTDILRKTLLHELGHTIGLDHSEQEAIMAAAVGSIQNLTSDDVSGGIAVVEENLWRQQVGIQQPQDGESGSSSEETSGTAGTSCGSIDLNGPSNGPGGPATFSFLISLLLGLLGSRYLVLKLQFS